MESGRGVLQPLALAAGPSVPKPGTFNSLLVEDLGEAVLGTARNAR